MTYCIAVIQILVKYFLSQSDRCFTPALHFVSSPVKLLRKTHQEMDFHKENPKLAEELKFQRQDDFTGPQMKPSLLQSDRWSMTSRGMNEWPTSLLSLMNLNLILPPTERRRPPKGGKYFYRARIPADWVSLYNRPSTWDIGRWTPSRSSCALFFRSQSSPASTLYLSLMGKP